MDSAVVSWIAESEISRKQERAQIIVASDPEMEHIIYASDAQANPDSTGVKLPIELKPRTSYYWTVQVWGDGGDTAVSPVNYFETGKREEPLGGQWLTTPWEDKKISPYVRKRFRVEGEVCRARLYITGLGLYLPEVNGKKVSEEYFAPGCTAVDRWAQIYTYDVTELVSQGENVLGVLMGNGWTKGRFGASSRTHTKRYLEEYLLKAELRLEYADGSEQIIVTDDSWKCAPSPILEDNLYDGEVFDERKTITNWSCAEYSDADWDQMALAENVQAEQADFSKVGNLEDRLSPPVIIKEMIKPVALLHTPANELVLDMGQNMVGWIRMKVNEPVGTAIKLTHGEILQDDCFYRDNLRTAKAEYVYISDGTEKVVEPHFTFYGFRYVKVERIAADVNVDGCAGDTVAKEGAVAKSELQDCEVPGFDLSDFEGCVVYSDLDETGWFTTSDERVNRLFLNAKWSQKDNFLDVPTDCPQRDERMGWTGDAQVFCETASYNMDTYAFYTKFLHDLWREQQKNHGMVSHVVPSLLRESFQESAFWHGGACVWGDAAVIMPWTLYKHYGDITILERQYDSMKAWIDWIVRTYVDENGLWSGGFQFGDWLALDGEDEFYTYGGTDRTYIASMYLRYCSGMVAEAAKVLAESTQAAGTTPGGTNLAENIAQLYQEEEYYRQISERTKAALQKTYFEADGSCILRTQTAHVLALNMNVAEGETRKKIAGDLVALLQEKNMHLQTGFVGTPFLCKVLSAEGYSKEAYQIFFQNDFPSWLYEVDMGATTIWERWNSVLPDGKISGTGMNSLNHYAYGSIAQWMYENISGLTLTVPGFKRFKVQPEFTERFDFVEMKYCSPKGVIETRWERTAEDGHCVVVKVPFDTEAEVVLNGESYVVAAGEHRFHCGNKVL